MQAYPRDGSSPADAPPVVVAFVNKSSGERAAAAFVYEQLEACLGAERVLNLFPSPGEPPAIDAAKALLLRVRPDMVLVAGGDGTVSLGMDITDALRKEGKIGRWECAVAVLPMGTGNDLSRSLGFGGGYVKPLVQPEKKFAQLMDHIHQARKRNVDRFQCDVYLVPAATGKDDDDEDEDDDDDDNNNNNNAVSASQPEQEQEPNADGYSAKGSVLSGEGPENASYPTEAVAADPKTSRVRYRPPRGGAKVFSKPFMNYFSVGFDADIAADFGRFRENNPTVCSSRALNKTWYAFFGCKAMCCSSSFPKRRVSLRIDGVKRRVPSKTEAIVVSNMLTYAGGAVLWQDPKHKFPTPAVDDRKVEVCTLDGVMHMVGVGAHARSARKMGQGSQVRIRVPADYIMQYDGEPVSALGGNHQDCIVCITHLGQSLAMELSANKAIGKDDGNDGSGTGPAQTEANPIPLHAEEQVAAEMR